MNPDEQPMVEVSDRDENKIKTNWTQTQDPYNAWLRYMPQNLLVIVIVRVMRIVGETGV